MQNEDSKKDIDHSVATQQWKSLRQIRSNEFEEGALATELAKRVPLSFLSRREFMGWMGAMTALLGSGCTRQPQEKILPYQKQPEEIIPGKPLFFATSFVHDGTAEGVLVESHMGRPTKVEGNPEHPASLGATTRFAQAAILELYDPDRSKQTMYKGVATAWNNFVRTISKILEKQRDFQGDGIRILTESVSSPSLASQINSFLKEFPKAKWYQYEPVGQSNALKGSELVFGKPYSQYYDLKKADVVLSLNSDFLDSGPGSVRYSRDFFSRRKAGNKESEFNRLYVIETHISPTGSIADHRWTVTPNKIYAFALEIARQLMGTELFPDSLLETSWKKRAAVVARDLKKAASRSLVIPGRFESPELHALVHQINHHLGNTGSTRHLIDRVDATPQKPQDAIAELVRDMRGGKVGLFVNISGNPVVSMPGSLNFAAALKKVAMSVSLAKYFDETSELCDWHIPQAHFLESWGDARAYDGTMSMIQPLIRPLYDGKSEHELMAALLVEEDFSPYEWLKSEWKKTHPTNAEASWRQAIHDGVVAGSAFASKQLVPQKRNFSKPSKDLGSGLAVLIRPDANIWDGRFANNAWLQELPKPVSKVTWENVIQFGPKTAKEKKLKNGQIVEISAGGKKIKGPAWVVPGQSEATAIVSLGYGRTRCGTIGNDIGYDGALIRSESQPWFTPNADLKVTSKRVDVACTQEHAAMDGRELVRHSSVSQFQSNPKLFKSSHHVPGGHHEEHHSPIVEDPDYAWGMVIDLSACNGCNACVVGCQSENNVPVVGKDQVLLGREMAWIRVDDYFEGDPEQPKMFHQPVPCMHCEKAPCEVVCPVNATTHSPSGLNEMTYNRCVGTKYCGNNCPYKVRRFNFYHYADVDTPTFKLGKNPDVTVRGRGVMEKCTYCVQRINEARITAKRSGKKIQDGGVVSACQAACPSNAITFGNIKDPSSQVSKLRNSSLNYSLLEELGTLPRTTFLAKLNNPNPELNEAES